MFQNYRRVTLSNIATKERQPKQVNNKVSNKNKNKHRSLCKI